MRVALRRLVQTVPTILIVVVANFFLLRLVPGDTVDALLSEAEGGDLALKERLREELGLNKPLWIQLAIYLRNILGLDLGFSYTHSSPVLNVVLDRLWPSLLLMLTSIALAVLLGSLMGMIAARSFRTWRDSVITVLALVLYATPAFWFGLMAIVLFSIKMRLLPVGGLMSIGQDLSGLALAADVAWHLLMPAVTLSLFHLAIYARLMRTSMLEVLGQDFIRTARAKGAPEGRILRRHALRNAVLPVITLLGLQVGSMLGGAIVVETVFSWPGLGRLAFEAVLQRDYNILLAIMLVSVVVVSVVNLAVDCIYAWIDPRIEID